MGLLRLLLALSVVIAHSQPLFGFVSVGPVRAVESFFIISGFYMALILNEKYVGERSYRLFITNRCLRLFPAYWVVLILAVALSFVFFKVFGTDPRMSAYVNFAPLMEMRSLLVLVLTNIFMFGQDIVMFLKLNPGGALAFTTNFRITDSPYPPLYLFLFIPQAWTLGIELVFYLIAPFLVRKNLVILLTGIALSFALRAYIYGAGLNYDPWNYRFFPLEIAFFMLGAVSYRIYRKLKDRHIGKGLYRYAFYFIIVFTVFYQVIPIPFKQWVYYLAVALCVPAIFAYTKDNKLDNYIGELSYPIYISHLLVLNATTYKLADGNEHPGLYLASLAAVIAFSLLLVHAVIRPIERYRQGRLKKLGAQRVRGSALEAINN